MSKLVLLRHGQSQWNLENRFTGWVDVELTPKGEEEAHRAGKQLKEASFRPVVAFTSNLKRAQRTLAIALGELGLEIPVHKNEALNERHYGDLQGKNKAETAQQFGEEQVKIWRRSFDIPPPNGESLKDTAERTLPYFESKIVPELKAGKDVLVAAHGNSLRSIVMAIEKMTPEQILQTEMSTGTPWIYEVKAEGNTVTYKRLTSG
jgi:2,3-bisphosphoglycerate-dependent phosphoglycerate mutase